MSKPTIVRLIPWLQRHRRLARLLVRGPVRDWVSRRVWAGMEARPGFNEFMREAGADFAAGRWYRWNHEMDEMVANPDWPADGPQPNHPRGEWARRRPSP